MWPCAITRQGHKPTPMRSAASLPSLYARTVRQAHLLVMRILANSVSASRPAVSTGPGMTLTQRWPLRGRAQGTRWTWTRSEPTWPSSSTRPWRPPMSRCGSASATEARLCRFATTVETVCGSCGPPTMVFTTWAPMASGFPSPHPRPGMLKVPGVFGGLGRRDSQDDGRDDTAADAVRRIAPGMWFHSGLPAVVRPGSRAWPRWARPPAPGHGDRRRAGCPRPAAGAPGRQYPQRPGW